MEGFKEFTGKSLDDAIHDACSYYDSSRERLEIDIVQDAKSGIFGLVGARKAIIRARRVQLRDAVEDILGRSKKSTASKSEAKAEAKVHAKAEPKAEAKAKAAPKAQEQESLTLAQESASAENASEKNTQDAKAPNRERNSKPRREQGKDSSRDGGKEQGRMRDNKERHGQRTERHGNRVERDGNRADVDGNRADVDGNRVERSERPERAPRRENREGRDSRDGREGRDARQGRDSRDGREHKRQHQAKRQSSKPAPTEHLDSMGFGDDVEEVENVRRIPIEELDQERLHAAALEAVSVLTRPIVGEVPLEVKIHEGRVHVHLDCEENSGLLIGREGQTLASLQYITSRIVSRVMDAAVRVQLDAGDYRTRQDEKLSELATALAERVRATGKAHSTRPLSSYHRRIVHVVLQDATDLVTRSSGDGPLKRVIIQRKRG